MINAKAVKDKIRPMFDCFDDSVLYSYFDGIYGEAYCDNISEPRTAIIVSGDFYFVAGEINCGSEIMDIVGDNRYAVIIPSERGWISELESTYKLLEVSRYRTEFDSAKMDMTLLDKTVDMIEDTADLKFETVDERYYYKALEKDFSKSFVENFADYEDYKKHGFGFVVTRNGEIISGTSTYSYYNKGVEIEVATDINFRHKKLATVCSAAFLKECVRRVLVPHWDARNKMSLAIAEKMGFKFKEEYLALEFDQSCFENKGEI